MTDHKTSDSMLFSEEDYPGIWMRAAIVLIDSVVLLCVSFTFAMFCYAVGVRNPDGMWLASSLVFFYVYLTVLKQSQVRTVAFRVMGARIVNDKAERPSIFRMMFRLLIWAVGPFNVLMDFLWLGGDRNRQTLRDKFSGTWVVRRNAVPASSAKRKATSYNVGGLTCIFWELLPRDELDTDLQTAVDGVA